MLPEAAILALVAQQTTNAVIITDGAGLIEWVNVGFTRMSGYDLDEVRGRKPGMFLQGPDTDVATIARISVALRSGQSFADEILNYRKDGHAYWVAMQISPVFDASGEVVRFVAIESDVSARRAADAALRQSGHSLQAIMAMLPIMLFATDTAGIVTLCEGRGLDTLALDDTPLAGRSVFMALAHAPELLANIRRALVGESFVSVVHLRELVFEMRYAPLRDAAGALTGMLCVALDATERMQATAELVRARDEAEAATRAKSAFLATMSHEIRTPLNAVIGMAGLLLDTPMNAEQRRYAETIRTSGDMLLAVINDILDFSKIEAGNMGLEQQPFDLRVCIEEVIDLLAPRAAEKGLRLAAAIDYAVPERIISDLTRVRQILVNLVGNAVKFTTQGEVLVRVSTSASATVGMCDLRMLVSDTGIGIPADRQARLFQPFSQGDASTTRRFGGTGLGLAICKRLCDLMGGSIEVVSELGRGSTFSVSLPVVTASVSPRPRGAAAVATNGLCLTLRILLAEDNVVNQQVALRMLDRLGLRADLAANGLEAISALERQDYDVVLMDVQMPEMDGLEATRHLRATLPPARQPYIVAMTAGAMVGDREACLVAGMDDYISKPVQREDLLAALQRTSLRPVATEASQVASELLDLAAINRLRADLGPLFAEDLIALIETYRRQLRADVAAMSQAVVAGDSQRVALLAHRLRGASATLGARQAAGLCLMLEQPDQAVASLLSLAEQLLTEGERAAAALEALATT